VLLVALSGCGGEEAAPPVAEAPAGLDWRRDDRLAFLDERCPGKGRFDEDTSDLLPVLVGKLRSSQRDVLRNVREELSRAGEPALVELERLVRRMASDPHGSPTILNALAVVRNSEAATSSPGRALVRFCLGHPQETVRNAAVRVLSAHSDPEAYADLSALLAVASSASRQDLVSALVKADPRRFEADLVVWIEAGEHRDLWPLAARLVAAGADAETAGRLAPLVGLVDAPDVRAFLVATQDHAEPPAEGRLALLEAMLGEEDPGLRLQAVSALEFTGATELLARTLREDADAGVRNLAVGILVGRTDEPLAVQALEAALFDGDEKVREAALGGLLATGSPVAVDTALALWGGGLLELGLVTRAARGHWEANPGLAERALEVLVGRLEERAEEPLARREALIQALAQVPGPDSTRWLLEHARSESGTVAGLGAHRYLTMQAGNTGEPGLELVREAWRLEEDEARRLDLLWSATVHHDEATRRFLLEVVQAERTLPHERLWAAERLAREGPAAEVAPVLKRVNLRIDDREVRPAFECLLWRWYG
jgi:HEAT repeat protein